MPFTLPSIRHFSIMFVAFIAIGATLTASPTGPTLRLDYNGGQEKSNALSSFMYFIPLISTDPIFVFTNAGNTQSARVTALECTTNGALFHAVCEFDFTGAGLQENVFDHSDLIHRREQQLKAGKPLQRQLAAINVTGAGRGAVEIEGTFTNDQPEITEMRLRFNSHGHASPVSIQLQDLCWRDGKIQAENELVARVNMLTFRGDSNRPSMEVALASIKRKDAADSLWQDFVGGLKGAAANLLLPPLPIAKDGQTAMMSFGLALVERKATFTFPVAARLRGVAPR
ncbi:MAG TPA: hypothetical protein VF988_08000 [Verrucomicrobiae bacterium]